MSADRWEQVEAALNSVSTDSHSIVALIGPALTALASLRDEYGEQRGVVAHVTGDGVWSLDWPEGQRDALCSRAILDNMVNDLNTLRAENSVLLAQFDAATQAYQGRIE